MGPPLINHAFMRLLALPNFTLTPHVAWASREAIQSLADQLIENIELFWYRLAGSSTCGSDSVSGFCTVSSEAHECFNIKG